MSFSAIRSLVQQELDAVNTLIRSNLTSPVKEIELIGHYLIESGGKRIRPIVTLLSSLACGLKVHSIIEMATIIEFIHSATLLHDDVVDGSNMRRGQPTANHVWDNASAVLVGDFLYSRAFQMMVKLKDLLALHILADATNAIAEGEVMQLTHRFAPDITEEGYFRVIRLKTAKLFEAAAELGAVLANQSPWREEMREYGLRVGTAFQLIDDLLDYEAEPGKWGKNLGDDLAEGKVTLPLLRALACAKGKEIEYLRKAIKTGDINDLSLIHEIIVSSGGIDYTRRAAEQEAQQAILAIEKLPESEYKMAMINLATFAVERNA